MRRHRQGKPYVSGHSLKPKTKAQAQVAHVKKRIWQRHGFVADSVDLSTMVRMIQSNEGEFIMRQSNRVSIWGLYYHGMYMVVVYDRNTKNITTALPPENWG